MVRDTSSSQDTSNTPNLRLRFLPQIILEICSGHDYSIKRGQGQGHSDTPPSQDAFTNQILNSYLKEYKRYAPYTIIL